MQFGLPLTEAIGYNMTEQMEVEMAMEERDGQIGHICVQAESEVTRVPFPSGLPTGYAPTTASFIGCLPASLSLTALKPH